MTLRNGGSVRLRAIRPDDEPRLLALCRRLSPGTVYQRFFSSRPLRAEEAHALANVDYRRRMAVVAEIDDAGQEPELIGVAQHGPSNEGRTADIGLVVADGWQGLGLGSILLEKILRAGEQRGIHEFSADVLTENRRALHQLARQGVERDSERAHKRTGRAESFTGYAALKLVEVPRPRGADGRVLVRVTAAGVTPLVHRWPI